VKAIERQATALSGQASENLLHALPAESGRLDGTADDAIGHRRVPEGDRHVRRLGLRASAARGSTRGPPRLPPSACNPCSVMAYIYPHADKNGCRRHDVIVHMNSQKHLRELDPHKTEKI